MIDFGQSLKTAREAKGLTIEQISEETHMATKTIRELESEDFTAFPAAIYGRGFVKLYCGAVGLEPKPFLDEFMEIYNGNRDLTIREREVPAENPPIAADSPAAPASPVSAPQAVPASSEPIREPSPAVEQMDFISPRAPQQSEQPIAAEPPAFSEPTAAAYDESSAPSNTPSRYSNPIYNEIETPRGFSIPPAAWRLSLLAIIALALLWGVYAGLKALHNSICGEEESVAADSPRVEESPTAKPRTPQKIPSLYID